MQIVAEEDPAPVLALRLPAGADAAEWHCRTEDGGEHAGRSNGSRIASAARACRSAITGWRSPPAAVTAEIGLIVAPRICHLPDALQPGARSWGLTVQLYGLRSARNWGIGDFTDLAELCRRTGTLGGAVVGINPLHALFAAEPRHFSPYSPSSRGLAQLPLHRLGGGARVRRRRGGAGAGTAGRARGGPQRPNWSITPPSRR